MTQEQANQLKFIYDNMNILSTKTIQYLDIVHVDQATSGALNGNKTYQIPSDTNKILAIQMVGNSGSQSKIDGNMTITILLDVQQTYGSGVQLNLKAYELSGCAGKTLNISYYATVHYAYNLLLFKLTE